MKPEKDTASQPVVPGPTPSLRRGAEGSPAGAPRSPGSEQCPAPARWLGMYWMGAAGAENCNFPGLCYAAEIKEQGRALATTGKGAFCIQSVPASNKNAIPAFADFPFARFTPSLVLTAFSQRQKSSLALK